MRRVLPRLVAVLGVLLLCAGAWGRGAERLSLLAEEAARSFERGLSLLENDRESAHESLRASIDATRGIIDAGVRNAGLYYNIANAHLLMGDTGRAVLNYRRARLLAPSDANISQNLALARSRVLSRVDRRLGAPARGAAVLAR